jgi:hypothetical protein
MIDLSEEAAGGRWLKEVVVVVVVVLRTTFMIWNLDIIFLNGADVIAGTEARG